MTTRKVNPQDWKEARRLRALELWQEGWEQHEIAEALGVSQAAVSQWLKVVETQGVESLLARPRTGAPSRLTVEQMNLIPDFLAHGAEAYGIRGEVWTCARIAEVIRLEFGVSYHKAHVSRLLQELRWTPQKPLERASQRDEKRIEEWRTEDWKEIKKSSIGAKNPCLY